MAGKYPILLGKNQLHRHFLSVLISIEAFYLVEKQNQEDFMKFFRRFVDSGIVKTCDELDLSEESMLVDFSFLRRGFYIFFFLFSSKLPWKIVNSLE